MCTINSLERIWQQLDFPNSVKSVLVVIFLICHQGRSGASSSQMAISVQAPPDITIHIRSVARCDTSINLPLATFSGNCSNVLTYTTWSNFNTRSTNGGGPFYFPTGVHKVYYQVSDNCRMTGLDSMIITVFDAELPQVVCQPVQTINLPDNGYAEAPAYIFDGGSSDQCGHVYFKVRRMFPSMSTDCQIPGTTQLSFTDQVSFCCADVDSNEILILLRVYDIFPGIGPVSDTLLRGHYVDCMVRAIVLDKLTPELTCPPDITIACIQDLDSLLSLQQLKVFDNCGVADVDTLDDNNLDACGSGTFIRTYQATDLHSLVSSCRQTITVLRSNTFNGLDTNQLKWPKHITVYACRIAVDTIQSGAPVLNDDACALVLKSFRDEVYQFNHGGVCAKLLRYWEVIDWCKYNPLLKPNPKIPANGYYSYVQEIKVFDTVQPVVQWISDTIIGISTPDCGPGFITLPQGAATDCSSSGNISFRFEIDLYANGSIDQRGMGNQPSGIFPIGQHLITLFAKDSCHNESAKTIRLTVRDAKKPNPLAMYGISSSLINMPNGPMVSITARLFNNKSTDNCTVAGNLRFSFSGDIQDTVRVYNCDSLGRRDVLLVVWDEAGNSSEVFTYVVIDDIYGICPTTIQNIKVDGNISTSNKQAVPEVEVTLTDGVMERKEMTDKHGSFVFNDIPGNHSLQIFTRHDRNFADGLTTADVVKIQRHILGIELFENPMQWIAADLDMNKNVSTKDIVYLRNLILGKITALPHQKSYVFIDPLYLFNDPDSPLNELESCQDLKINNFSSNQHINIRAIKLGDVNLSYTANGINKLNQILRLKYKIDNQFITIYSSQSTHFNGFQLSIDLDGLCKNRLYKVESDLSNWSNAFYDVRNNLVVVSYNTDHDVPLAKETPLLRLVFDHPFEQCTPEIRLTNAFLQEWYEGQMTYDILLAEEDKQIGIFDKVRIEPNPFSTDAALAVFSNQPTDVTIEIYSTDNRLICSKYKQLLAGDNRIQLDDMTFLKRGVYYFRISNVLHSETLKVIKL